MVVSDRAKLPVRSGARGNNLDDVRRNNLSAVLNLVHTTGAVTRAQLTRETGLNRSTIGALVGELVNLQLVEETEPDTTNQVGRPSLMIKPARRTVALAVNPELDAVTIGLVALGGQVIKRIRYDTVRVPSVEEVVNIVSAVVAGMRDELETNYKTIGVGLAVPGLVRAGDGLVNLAPHLGWHHAPLSEMLEQSLRLPVHAANDAAVGALGESIFGSGRGVRNMVYLNGGASGIGGGVVNNGVLLTGESGYAGELGHTLVNSNGELCHCGAYGCLETEVKRQALLDALGLPVNRVEELDEVLRARLADPAGADPELVALVNRQLDFLSITIRNAVNLFNPELIVLGGFLGSLYESAPERLEGAVARSAMLGSGDTARITRSSLGRDLLVVGAAQLAFAPLLADPAGAFSA
ncbi:ROK family protein [Herbiconiux ginsengi]|uniref:Sugar kinase of the NBD/HSP70 family, may contain an N-terminal HTH domain n=1 Tax=Herbiconiux ginsengi TaxID=381665 RepID=A0A1H3RJ79_9MICO|nr:ROK family protein [Herbiconiux ginsengi]SDZ25653.1 Sugar kinase of the NBD/HSP70 family, may contain an N-terminal HTH domain [Herbiconiux ginsengi]